jgi:glutamyl-tRNA synthetase
MTDCFFTDDFIFEEDGKVQLAKEEIRSLLQIFAARLETLEDFRREAIEKTCRELAHELEVKAGSIIHPARMAVSGKSKGAGLFEMMELLGKDRVLKRIRDIRP